MSYLLDDPTAVLVVRGSRTERRLIRSAPRGRAAGDAVTAATGQAVAESLASGSDTGFAA